MRQEIALDEVGSPLVYAFRDDEGRLTFRYLTVRAGGMGVWVPVPDAGSVVAGQNGQPDELLTQRLRSERRRLAESIAAGDAAQSEREAGLTDQVEALGEQLEDANAELQVRLDENADLRRRVEELEAEKPGGTPKTSTAAAAGRKRPRAAA